jgi:hypothetical protein
MDSTRLTTFLRHAQSEPGVDFQEKHLNGSADKADKVLYFLTKVPFIFD